MNKSELEDYRLLIKAQLIYMQPNIFLTFNFNPPISKTPTSNTALLGAWQISPDRGKAKLSTFFNMLQRKTYGRGWYRDSLTPRPRALGFLEHSESNFHYHVLANLEPSVIQTAFDEGPFIWDKLCGGGQIDAREIYQIGGAVSYVTKDLRTEKAVEAMFTYSDPHG